MKKYFLLSVITVLFFAHSFAQSVGINNDGSAPNPAAMLDVNSPSKGLLVPRVTLTGTDDVSTISTPVASLLVFNTSTTAGPNAVSPGYYYWNGSAWVILSTGFPSLKKDNVDSVSNTGYATVYSRNKARDSVQANINLNNASILAKKDNVDSVSDNGYATVYSRNKARDSVQANVNLNNAGILAKKDNVDSVSNTGYATVYSRNKARDSVQANINLNNAGILAKKDNVDSVSNTGYATVYSRNKARDSVAALAASKYTLPAFKVGSLLYYNGSTLAEDFGNMYWDSTNKYMGIGTTSPTTILHLKKNVTGTTVLKLENTFGAFNLGLTAQGGYSQPNSTGLGHTIYNGLGTTYITVAAAGGVGINTMSPTGLFEINNGTANAADGLILNSNSTTFHSPRLFFVNTQDPANGFTITKDGGSGTASYLGFSYNSNPGSTTGTFAMGLYNNGNIGIGQLNPAAKLHIRAGTAAAGTAPLKLETTGSALLTTPEAGAIEVLNNSLYYTGINGVRNEMKYNADSIANTGYATIARLNKARDSVQANLTANSLSKKDITDSVANTGYATVYSRNKARDSLQANINLNNAGILLKKDNVDSVSNTGYATVYSRNKARDSVQANITSNNAGILLKKDNVDSVSNTGYATVYSRNKARDSVQANITSNNAGILLKKDNVDSVSNTGYATVYSRNKARDSVQANITSNNAGILLKKDNADSTNPITGYTTRYQNSLKEAPLDISTGLTRSGNTITNNLSVGVPGGQSLIGSSSTNSGMTYIATSGAGVTGADHIFKVGNNGAVEAMRIVSDSLGYVGIGTSSPTTVLHLKKNLPAPGHNTVLKIENAYGAGNFGFNTFGAYWQNSAAYSGNGGGFNIYNLGGSGFFGIQTNGNVGVGLFGPQAYFEIKPGNTGHVPFRLNSGPLATGALAGGIEFLGDNFYGTITSGNARKTFAFLESPTFTGSVGGITKSMVGLGNVDNTSDVNKPVSTATQAALDAKWGTSGNTGTGPANFIGTSDNTPFNVRVNNQNAGRIDNTLLNSFWGFQAGNTSSTGTSNTAIGSNSLIANTTGNANTALGSGANVSTDGLTNATALGAGAIVDASNKVRIGNTSVTVIEGQVAYSFPSDARFKYNIKQNVPGLDFIKKLVPVTYYFDENKLAQYTKTGIMGNSNSKAASYQEPKQLHTGFLAQDVEKIAAELGYNFDGLHVPSDEKDHYSLAYTQFIMPLVKSVQEQQKIIEDQDKKLESQAEQIQKMNEKMEALAKAIEELTKK